VRQLHIIRHPGDVLALEVIGEQLRQGDEVRVVAMGAAVGMRIPGGDEALGVPPAPYDALVELLVWCERVVSW
jgi:hypothetical protein